MRVGKTNARIVGDKVVGRTIEVAEGQYGWTIERHGGGVVESSVQATLDHEATVRELIREVTKIETSGQDLAPEKPVESTMQLKLF